jgi:hypothetical protein
MLFSMCVLWTMAVPAQRPRQPSPAARSAPAAPAAATRPALPSDHVDGVWSPPGFGLRMSAPAEWTATRSRGRARLTRDPADPGRGQFELDARAQLAPQDLAQRAEAWGATLASRAGFELLASGATAIGSRPAWRLEYRVQGADGQALRCAALLWSSGPQELTLVFSALERHWGEVGALGAAGLASLDLGPRSR